MSQPLGTKAPSWLVIFGVDIVCSRCPSGVENAGKNTETWNAELGSTGEWGVERRERYEKAGKALEEGGGRF